MSRPPEIMTPGSAAPAAVEPRGTPSPKRSHVEEQLDAALDASFPASDPVAIVTSQSEEDWGEKP